MARPWRVEFPDAVYHLMSRGNQRRKVFLDDDDRSFFLSLLGQCSERYQLEVFAFCLMPNHFHLFLRTPKANLSRAMQWLLGVYTQRFNRRHGQEGHLFRGRYRAVPVVDESHWLTLSAYLHLNPVRAGLAADPAGFTWSSFVDYTRARPRYRWLQREPALYGYGPSDETRRRNYRRAVLELAGRKPRFWAELRSAVFLGEPEKYEELRRLHAPSRPQSVPDYWLKLSGPVVIEDELARVAEALGVEVEEIRSGRRKLPLRPATYYHLTFNCGLAGARVAEFFGVSEAAVSLGVKKCRALVENDDELADKLNKLKT